MAYREYDTELFSHICMCIYIRGYKAIKPTANQGEVNHENQATHCHFLRKCDLQNFDS